MVALVGAARFGAARAARPVAAEAPGVVAGPVGVGIVDPQTETITVLVLEDGVYAERGRFAEGQRADSSLLPGFGVDTEAAFAAE